MKRYRHLISLLLFIAGSTAAMAQTSNPFIVSYWTKTKNDTLLQVAFNGCEPNQLKYIRRQPANNANINMGIKVAEREGYYVTNPQTIYYPREGQPVSVTYTNQCRVDYTASDGTQAVTTPSVSTTVKVSLKSDNCHSDGNSIITEVIRLEPFITVSGWNPQTVNVLQQILIGPQVVTFEWSYEDYGLLRTKDGMVAQPTLQPEQPELIEITAKETAASRQASARLAPMTVTLEQGQQQSAASRLSSLGGGERTYEVTARFRQTLIGTNTSEPTSEDLTFEAKYNVVFENKLISTTYEKDYEWIEAHDNLPPTTYYILRRIRTYSSGEKLTDTFVCPHGWSVEENVIADVNGNGDWKVEHIYQHNDSVRFIYHNMSDRKNDDYVDIFYLKTGVPDLNLLSWEIDEDFDGWVVKKLDEYGEAASNSFYYNSNAPVEDWYASRIQRHRRIYLYYNFNQYEYQGYVRNYLISFGWYDRFLYLDGQLFDFSDYKMTFDFDFREESTTLSDGTPAKVFTHDCTGHYLGRDFYIATVDTVYQLPK